MGAHTNDCEFLVSDQEAQSQSVNPVYSDSLHIFDTLFLFRQGKNIQYAVDSEWLGFGPTWIILVYEGKV